MAYTDKDAIYEIAEKLGWSGTEGQTTVEAVYAVAEALGYTGDHDSQVALALSDLKTVVTGGGGGGGGDLGALQPVPLYAYSAEPSVGGTPDDLLQPLMVKIGDDVAVEGDTAQETFIAARNFAAGVSLVMRESDEVTDTVSGYIVTLDGNSKFATVAAWNGTINKSDSGVAGHHDYTFTMPTLETDTFLVVYAHMEGGGSSNT